MDNSDLYVIEQWKTIPLDTKYVYQASDVGRISRLYDNGKRKILSECYLKSMNGWVTSLTMADGTYRKFQTISLVAKTWLGIKPSCYQAIHKNGIKSDHRLTNITYIKRSDIGKICNTQKRKAVLKINQDGEIVEIYKSATECAEKNFYTKGAIKTRCAGNYKTIFANDGYAYCYESNTRYFEKIMRTING